MSNSSTAGNGQAEYSMETLSVNGKQIEVNKFILAYNSRHFEDIFFGKYCKNEENTIIQIDPPATPEHFQRMLDAMKPQDRPVDDQCVEGVLHLAKQFRVLEVEGKCHKFFRKQCQRSAIFKFRLADDDLKNFLNSSKKEDFFKWVDFVENLEEFAKLDEPAREALATRLRQLLEVPMPARVAFVRRIAFYAVLGFYGIFGWPKVSEDWHNLDRISEFASQPGAAVLLVNGKEVPINKYYLASKSAYFERFFFGQGYKKNTKLELEPPANAAHFELMLDTLEPWNRPLDDGCIEPVLHLANRFFVLEVEEKCHNFLAEKSNHLAIFKYRLINKYGGSDRLKEQILDSSKKEDFFKEADFVDNLEEFAQLDGKAREALAARLRQLFASQ